MSRRLLNAIYCDDIRHEMSGKLSLIGCYAGEMYVPSFPVTLPRVCVHFTITTPHTMPFVGPLTVSVMQDDSTLVKMDLDASWTKNFPETLPAGRENYVFMGGVEISPASFQAPATLRIIAECNGETLFGPKLWVMEQPRPSEDARI